MLSDAAAVKPLIAHLYHTKDRYQECRGSVVQIQDQEPSLQASSHPQPAFDCSPGVSCWRTHCRSRRSLMQASMPSQPQRKPLRYTTQETEWRIEQKGSLANVLAEGDERLSRTPMHKRAAPPTCSDSTRCLPGQHGTLCKRSRLNTPGQATAPVPGTVPSAVISTSILACSTRNVQGIDAETSNPEKCGPALLWCHCEIGR